MTRVLLLAANESLTERVESIPDHHVASMSADQFEGVRRVGGFGALIGSGPEHVPDLVLIGDGIAVSEGLTLAAHISEEYSFIQVALVAEVEADLVMRAMRVGVREILSPNVTADELKVLLHRCSGNAARHVQSAPVDADARDSSRVIVVAAPKGGVGKSMVAANVAVALAQRSPMETVLVDLDLQFGDAASLLNLRPTSTVADAFGAPDVLDTLILKTFLTIHPSGFYVLCGAKSPTLSDSVTGEQISFLLRQLSSQFRYVVVDTAAGLDECTLSALEEASDVVLVSNMDATSTNAMRKEIAVLTQLDLMPESRHLVLNFADRRSGVGVREVEAKIGLPVDVVVPRSSDVQLASNLGEAMMDRRRGGPVQKAIRQLVTRIHDEEEADVQNKHRGIAVA